MEPRKMVQRSRRNRNTDVENRHLGAVGDRKGQANWEDSTDICILLCVKKSERKKKSERE